METRANYIAVGFFTLLVLFAAFAFVYWRQGYGQRAHRVPMQVRIEGAATGLSEGSPVLFNGILIGTVVRMDYDPTNPKLVLISTQVDRNAPIRVDTKASLGIQGVTGSTYVHLEGGGLKSASLFDEAEKKGAEPQISARPAAISELIDRIGEIATQTETMMSGLEKLVAENRGSINNTVKNVETFSKALSENAPAVEKFMASAGDMAASMQGLSDKLDGTISAAEKIAKAIDPEQVREVVANITQFTETLKNSEGRIEATLKSIDEASANLTKFTADLQNTLSKVDKVVGAVDAEEIRKTVSNIEKVTRDTQELVASIDRQEIKSIVKSTREAIEKASTVIAAVKPEQVAKVVENLESVTGDAKSLVAQIDKNVVAELLASAKNTIDQASKVMEAIQPAKISNTVDELEKTASGARKIVDDVSVISTRLSKRGDDVDNIVTDVRQLAANLNKASTRIDGILGKADGLLGSSDTNGVMQDARTTLAAFRTLAVNLDKRVAEISRGITKFTNRGLGGTQELIRNASRSINRFDRVISNFERNPASLLSGSGTGVREMSGSRVRR